MQGMLTEAPTKGAAIEQQFRTFLLQMENRTDALQIAQLMGIELDDMGARVKTGVATAQQNFAQLPEVMRRSNQAPPRPRKSWRPSSTP